MGNDSHPGPVPNRGITAHELAIQLAKQREDIIKKCLHSQETSNNRLRSDWGRDLRVSEGLVRREWERDHTESRYLLQSEVDSQLIRFKTDLRNRWDKELADFKAELKTEWRKELDSFKEEVRKEMEDASRNAAADEAERPRKKKKQDGILGITSRVIKFDV